MKNEADKSRMKTTGNSTERRGNTSKNSEIETYLRAHYVFRYNTVLDRTEYRSNKDVDCRFTKVGRYEINSLRRELDLDMGIITSSDNLYSIIESSFSPRINPIQEYFKALPEVDASEVLHKIEVNQSTIANLASCVIVRNSEKWLPYLTKWLVAVVTNAMDDRECRNHTCLVLTGEQGKFKTTFLDLLCPPALKGYSYTGKIYPQEKDTLTSMDAVYTEAKALLKSGFRYWFNDDEIAELYRESEDFQVQTAEMELLLRCFEKPTEDNPHCAYMTTTEILAYLGVYTHQPLTFKRMGEALKRAGFEKVSKRREGCSPVYVYKIRKIHPCPLVNSCGSLM